MCAHTPVPEGGKTYLHQLARHTSRAVYVKLVSPRKLLKISELSDWIANKNISILKKIYIPAPLDMEEEAQTRLASGRRWIQIAVCLWKICWVPDGRHLGSRFGRSLMCCGRELSLYYGRKSVSCEEITYNKYDFIGLIREIIMTIITRWTWKNELAITHTTSIHTYM